MNFKACNLFFVFMLSIVVIGCSQPPVDQANTPVPAVEQPTLTPTGAITATETPIPATNTPVRPTDTPLPTATPAPTDTPTITPTFSPQSLTFAAGEPVKIGYLLWESNPIGVDSKRSIEMAIEEFGGEILGHPIELVGYDEECNELAGQRGAQILALDDTVLAVIGTTCSRSALRAAKIISDAGKILISGSNTSPELTAPASRQSGYFRISPNDIFQANAVAQFSIHKLQATKVATVFVANDKLQQFHSEFLCQSYTELGGECVLERPFPAGTTFMAPAINDLVAAKPDVIYITLWDPTEASTLITEIRAHPDLTGSAVVVWEGLNNPAFLQQAGELAVGVYVSTTSIDFDRETNAYQNFVRVYREKFGEDPVSDFHAFTYDAASLLMQAIGRTAVVMEDGSLVVDPLAMRDALYLLIEFPGLTGTLTCAPLGDCAAITDGKMYEFTSGDPNTFQPGPADQLSSNPSQVWP